MTYIELINEFWKQDRFKSFNDIDTRFYFFLLNECNIRNWLNPYELQTQYLEAMLQIKRKAIGEARNRLKQRGLIDFIAKTNNPTIYLITNAEPINELLMKLFPLGNNSETNRKHLTKQLGNNSETNIEDNRLKTEIKEKPPKGGKKKSLSPLSQIECFKSSSENESYRKFLDWLPENAPYVAANIQPLSEYEFEKLKAVYDTKIIVRNILNIENRKDLRKKYSSLYRTLINWCKNGYNE